MRRVERPEKELQFDNFIQQVGFNSVLHSSRLKRYITIVLVIAVLAGCGKTPLVSTVSPADVIAVSPTRTVTHFFSSPPTSESAPTSISSQPQRLEFNRYRHPKGLYELKYPSGWSTSQTDTSATFFDPIHGNKLEIRVTNTGLPLNEMAVLRFIKAREKNKFGINESYLEVSNQIGPDHESWLIQKQFTEKGNPISVLTSYRSSGDAILIVDIWSPQETYEENREVFHWILDSIAFHRDAASGMDALSTTEYFFYQNDFLSIEIPLHWNYKQSEGNNSIVDTFSSPDERAVVQVIVYDDGESLPRSVAGQFVQVLLRDYYTKDIHVTSDLLLADRRERLIWYSPSGDYQGITYFETRGTAMIVLTEMLENNYREDYEDQIEYIINSYKAKP